MKGAAAIIIPTRADDPCINEIVGSLSEDTGLASVLVVVVINGDRSCDTVVRGLENLQGESHRGTGMEIRIGRITRSSKPAAINRGEEIAGDVDLVAYIDDDVTVVAGSISDLFRTLRKSNDTATLVAPRRSVDSREGWIPRLFGSCVLRPRWTRNGVCMGGCFAVNRTGRQRWGLFPMIACDDEYVFSRFDWSERQVVPECTVTHPFAANLQGLLDQQARWRIASNEIRRRNLLGPYVGTGRSGRHVVEEVLRPRTLGGMIFVRVVRWCAVIRGRPSLKPDGAWES
ncbi:hypothetical protein OAR33_00370 [bacterium]|nr:hypothetical protein [bacterium]